MAQEQGDEVNGEPLLWQEASAAVLSSYRRQVERLSASDSDRSAQSCAAPPNGVSGWPAFTRSGPRSR